MQSHDGSGTNWECFEQQDSRIQLRDASLLDYFEIFQAERALQLGNITHPEMRARYTLVAFFRAKVRARLNTICPNPRILDSAL
jgi:hypothetical protein